MYRNRLKYPGPDYNTLIEKQQQGLEYMTRIEHPKFIFVGSSSVINGVDVKQMQKNFQDDTLVMNYAVTALTACEIPMMKKYFLDNKVKTMVYLYNTFSFPDEPYENASQVRWDTFEFFKIATPSQWWKYRIAIAQGVLGEIFSTVRYRNLIRDFISRALQGKLHSPADDYDYGEDDKPVKHQSRIAVDPLPISDRSRRIYVESDTENENLGYRSLRRALQLAKDKGIRVLVMPVPEPEFASYSKYRQGINIRTIDDHVAKICAEEHFDFLPRSEVSDIEAVDQNFRDHVHLHWKARKIYTNFLERKLKGLYYFSPVTVLTK